MGRFKFFLLTGVLSVAPVAAAWADPASIGGYALGGAALAPVASGNFDSDLPAAGETADWQAGAMVTQPSAAHGAGVGGYALWHLDETSDLAAAIVQGPGASMAAPGADLSMSTPPGAADTIALGFSYGARLAPDVSMSLTPSVSWSGSDFSQDIGGAQQFGLHLGMSWQINDYMGLSGGAGAVRSLSMSPQQAGTADGSGSSLRLYTGVALGFDF
jgi:hypothetical protein